MNLHEKVEQITKADVPNRHTMFQLNFFVLGKEPTHQAKLKRCVDELRSRQSTLESMKMEMDDLRDKNLLLEASKPQEEIAARMVERKVYANNKMIAELASKVRNTEEEMLFFVDAFERLNEVEAMKSWDDVDVQTQYWSAKLTEEVNHRLMMRLPIDVEIIKTALSLPDSLAKRQIQALLQTKVKMIHTNNGENRED